MLEIVPLKATLQEYIQLTSDTYSILFDLGIGFSRYIRSVVEMHTVSFGRIYSLQFYQ